VQTAVTLKTKTTKIAFNV